MKVKVHWQEWCCTWSHPTGGNYGYYLNYHKDFSSIEVAEGFATGLRTNGYIKNIRIVNL